MTSSDWTVKLAEAFKPKVMLDIMNRKTPKPNVRASADQQYNHFLEQLPTDVEPKPDAIISTFTSVMLNYKRNGRSRMKNFVYMKLISKFIQRFEMFLTMQWLKAVDLGPELEEIMQQSELFP